MDFRLNHSGVEETLKSSGFRSAIHNLAGTVADNVRGQKPGADVVVDDYVTDRAASSVTIREGAARLWQVRDGVLSRAAASAGLEVRGE